jgi:DNA-binding XRE family transcriptional regulator
MLGVLTTVFKASSVHATAIVLVDRAISVFSIVILGGIAYMLSSKPRGGGMKVEEIGPQLAPVLAVRPDSRRRPSGPYRAPRQPMAGHSSTPSDLDLAATLPCQPTVAARAVRKGHSRFAGRSDSSSIRADCPALSEPTKRMAVQNGRGFNEWLRAQLKAKKMSQRQLAQQSGVDHSTISRLIRGDRMPSLGTATKLARGLREIRDDAEAPQYLGAVTGGTPIRPLASNTLSAPTTCCPSRRSARSWSTTSRCGCAASGAATTACAQRNGPPWSRAGSWTIGATRR